MQTPNLFKPGAFIFIVAMIALLAWLTRSALVEEDPCADPQADISAAVLADEDGDQDALANRAIIMRGKCAKKE
jgi:hypothetical protein